MWMKRLCMLLFATIGLGGCPYDFLALINCDQSIAIEFPCALSDAADVLVVVAPGAFTWAELRNAATIRVHD
jgi:hypothetical protein